MNVNVNVDANVNVNVKVDAINVRAMKCTVASLHEQTGAVGRTAKCSYLTYRALIPYRALSIFGYFQSAPQSLIASGFLYATSLASVKAVHDVLLLDKSLHVL